MSYESIVNLSTLVQPSSDKEKDFETSIIRAGVKSIGSFRPYKLFKTQQTNNYSDQSFYDFIKSFYFELEPTTFLKSNETRCVNAFFTEFFNSTNNISGQFFGIKLVDLPIEDQSICNVVTNSFVTSFCTTFLNINYAFTSESRTAPIMSYMLFAILHSCYCLRVYRNDETLKEILNDLRVLQKKVEVSVILDAEKHQELKETGSDLDFLISGFFDKSFPELGLIGPVKREIKNNTKDVNGFYFINLLKYSIIMINTTKTFIPTNESGQVYYDNISSTLAQYKPSTGV